MKTVLLCLFIFASVLCVVAQTNVSGTNIYYNSGKIGIGLTNPTGKLHVYGGVAIQNPNISYNSNGSNVSDRAGIMFGANHSDCNTMFWISPDATNGNKLNIGTGTAFNDNAALITMLWNGSLGLKVANPTCRLDVNGSAKVSGSFKFGSQSSEILFPTSAADGYSGGMSGYDSGSNRLTLFHANGISFQTGSNTYNAANTQMFIKNDGNVGVGTTDPKAKLDVNGKLMIGQHSKNTNTDISDCSLDWLAGYQTRIRLKAVNTNPLCWNGCNGKKALTFNFHTTSIDEDTAEGISFSDTEVMRITPIYNGRVGIGTSSPAYKLDVAGTIRAEEILVKDIAATNLKLEGVLAADKIIVKSNGNTADFVFDDNYKLRDLSEVETYIKSNKHLPDVPSADEMDKEGVDLAEMNKLLLQKVEELTLYVVKQNTILQEQGKRLKKLEKDLEAKPKNYQVDIEK